MNEEFHISVILADNLALKQKCNPSWTISTYTPNIPNGLNHGRILNHLTWVYRKKSSSFRFRRARRNGLFLKGINERSLSKSQIAILYFRRIGWWTFRHHRHIIENRFVSPHFLNYLKRRISINQSMQDAISQSEPDLVCCPVSVLDYDAMDLIAITKRLAIPTLFIADNWDNVSSKTVYWERPTHFAVLGEQSKKHAIDIQGFRPNDVSTIGSARFSHYFSDRENKLASPYDFTYILFTGTALFFDEESCLDLLDRILMQNQNIFGDVKVIYRPHPHRQIDPNFTPKSLPNRVILDSQAQIRFGLDPVDPMSSTDLSYYSKLLSNAEFVVGGLTTMLLEATIFYKDFIALAHEDGINFTSQNRVLMNYEHLKGIETLPTVHLVNSLEHLEGIMVSTWKNRKSKSIKQIDLERSFFLFDDSHKFSIRLSRLINQILVESNMTQL